MQAFVGDFWNTSNHFLIKQQQKEASIIEGNMAKANLRLTKIVSAAQFTRNHIKKSSSSNLNLNHRSF